MQSIDAEANLFAVRRIAALVTLALAGLASEGCATSRTSGRGPVAPAQAAFGTLAPVTREAPRAEGAAYLALRVATVPDAEPEDRTALLLSASARCPADMALVDNRVCVDRWEGSIVERVAAPGGHGFVERAWSPYQPIDGHERSVRAVSQPGVFPQAYISGKQAAQACSASGKRLCAADGNDRRAGACNDDVRSKHPVAEVGHMLGIPHGRLWQDGMNQSIINQLPDTLTPTGERAECTNEYGVYDMVGNVHEWVDDAAGTFRGGYYMDTTKNGDGCSYQTTAHDFTYHDYSTGFRCCMDAESVE